MHRKIGMSGGLFTNMLLRETGLAFDSARVERLQKLHASAYKRLCKDVRPLPGAQALLATQARAGIPWAIATSGRMDTAGPVLATLGIDTTRTPVVTRDQVRYAKPEPDLFLAAADRLGVPIEAASVVGDSVWDMLAARRARALFSFLNAIFLRPLPVRDPGQIVAVFTSDFGGPLYGASSYPDYLDFREKSEAFADLAAYTLTPMSLSEGDHTDRIFGELVSANYFKLAGVEAARGRVFRPEEEAPDAAPAIVVSDGFWRRRFGADPGLVGRAVTLNGHPFTVVAIAPRAFTGMMRGIAVDLWVPMTMAGAIPSSDRWTTGAAAGC